MTDDRRRGKGGRAVKGATLFRVNARSYRRMAVAGDFGDTKVELLGGALTVMTTGPVHDYVVGTLHYLLLDRLGRVDRTVREEKPLNLGWFWRPLPDIAVVRGHRTSHAHRPPGRHDVALLVEVADTSYAVDAGRKLRRYLACGIPAYWIIDVNRRRVEVRDMRSPDGSAPATTYTEGAAVPLTLDGRDHGTVAVADLFA